MDAALLTKLALGFVAGAIAVVTANEIIKLFLNQAGYFPLAAWSMEPNATTGVPQIVSDVFWGGVWGLLFGLIYQFIPGDGPTLKGLIFGLVATGVLGTFILLPLITGRFPLFFGFDPKLIISVLLILAGFGATLGWVYGLLVERT